MRIFKVHHTDMTGGTITEEFYDSKNKAKKALKRMFKEIKPNLVDDDEVDYLSQPIIHRGQLNFMGKSTRSFELMFEVWRKCSYEYDEWDIYVEGLHIELIKVN